MITQLCISLRDAFNYGRHLKLPVHISSNCSLHLCGCCYFIANKNGCCYFIPFFKLHKWNVEYFINITRSNTDHLFSYFKHHRETCLQTLINNCCSIQYFTILQLNTFQMHCRSTQVNQVNFSQDVILSICEKQSYLWKDFYSKRRTIFRVFVLVLLIYLVI